MIRDYIQIAITKTPIARYSTVEAFRNRWKTKWIESIHDKQRAIELVEWRKTWGLLP